MSTKKVVLTKTELAAQMAKGFPSNILPLEAEKSAIEVVDVQEVTSDKASPDFKGTKLFIFKVAGGLKKYSLSVVSAVEAGAKVTEEKGKTTIDVDGMLLTTKEGSYAYELN